jgi:MFS transporter, DHA2 family, multidrug resistance protein
MLPRACAALLDRYETERHRFVYRPSVEDMPDDPASADAQTAIPSNFPDGHPRRWAILAVLVTSLLVVVLDNTILNVALKTIQLSLSATQSELVWAINSYILVFAALLFTWGVLGDRYGRKRILVIGMLLFGAASALSAFASSPEQLIVFRALMGIGGAAVLPVSLAIITVIFPPAERGRAVGLWAAAVGAAVAIGPIVGGFLLEHFWWGSVFLINVPVVMLGVAGILALVPETRDPSPRGFDPIGVLISIVGLLLLVYGIVHAGDTREWGSPSVLGWIVAGVVVLAGFVLYEMRNRHPSLDTALFRNADFNVSLASVSLTFFAMMGATFFLAFYLQFLRGFSPLEAGLCILPVAAGQLVSAPRSAALVSRFGARTVMTAGLLLVTVAFALLLLADVDTPLWTLLVTYLLIGLGMGSVIAPATTRMLATLPPQRAGAGSAVQTTMRQVGGALGVAILGSVLATVYGSQVLSALGVLPASAARAASGSVGTTYEVVDELVSQQALSAEQGRALIDAANTAFVDAMHVVTLIVVVILAVAAAVVFFFLPRHGDVGPGRSEAAHEKAVTPA